MGKKDKKQRHQPRAASYYTNGDEEEEAGGFIYPQDLPNKEQEPDPDDDFEAEEEEEEEVEEEGKDREKRVSGDTPSKFLLYQQSVQSPKGDISYLQKFFLMYVGGRAPLHLQEDFCGTALLSAEWLRSDSRRTAVGVDFDLEALNWCMENNINKVGADGYSRIFLYHGNVLQPSEAKLIKTDPQELIIDIQLKEHEGDREADPDSAQDKDGKRNCLPPARDIVCAFNYSCCCLHKRADLILYFKHVLTALSRKGGIFVMDLYGGSSSEHGLKLQRKFPDFTYVWEQAEFDIIERKTRISLHYHLQKPRKKIRHAFSYSWRLWSLPELKDCLEEVGFRSVHFWLRQMPDTETNRRTEGFGAGRDIKYEEVKSFGQQDAWNAYIVAVASKD